jgi:RNA polymerase sigma factor (sigma-70 family)
VTTSGPTQKAIAAVWRIEAPRLIGGLAPLVRDLDVAEDLAQEALVAALEAWPTTGIPDQPGAWLRTTAKNRAIDHLRRRRLLQQKHDELAHSAIEVIDAPDGVAVGDDLLRLILVACHPVLSKDARVALTLRLLGGLSTEEIAHAFLMPERTINQRIVRAKRTLAEARVPFEVPEGGELVARLPAALEVIYLIFNEGYAASAGASTRAASRSCSWTRTERAGITRSFNTGSPRSHGPRSCAVRSASTRCRRRSPAAMPARARPNGRTGHASWR